MGTIGGCGVVAYSRQPPVTASSFGGRWYRRVKWKNLLLQGVVSGVIVYFLVPSAIRPGRVVFGIIAFGITVLWDLVATRVLRRSRIRKALRARIGEDGPFCCVVTIDPSGLSVTQLDATTLRPWSAMRTVADTEHGV